MNSVKLELFRFFISRCKMLLLICIRLYGTDFCVGMDRVRFCLLRVLVLSSESCDLVLFVFL